LEKCDGGLIDGMAVKTAVSGTGWSGTLC